jgi:oxygen-independent coproporphyrinogen-3 oxidase
VGFVRTGGAEAGAPARGVRWRNPVAPDRYARGDEAETEALDAETLLRERIMLGLRVDGGLDLDAAGEELGVDPWPEERRRAAGKLEGAGRIRREGGRIQVPRAAWLWTDDTAARLF